MLCKNLKSTEQGLEIEKINSGDKITSDGKKHE